MSLAVLPSLLLLPPSNCLAAACVGAILHRTRVGRVLLVCGLGGLVLFAIPLVSGTLLVSLEPPVSTAPPRDPPQAIVILAGDETDIVQLGHETTMVGHLTLERERAGAALARRTALPILVTGGVMNAGDPTMATMMSESLQQDFSVATTWKEERAQDTWQNAAFSATILHNASIRSVYVVTHAWHMRRALIAFRAAGIEAVSAPVAVDALPRLNLGNLVPRVSSWQVSYYAAHEWIGTAWYYIRSKTG